MKKTLKDADIVKDDLDAVYFSNSIWGYSTGQHCIRGQVALRDEGIMEIPQDDQAGGAGKTRSA